MGEDIALAGLFLAAFVVVSLVAVATAFFVVLDVDLFDFFSVTVINSSSRIQIRMGIRTQHRCRSQSLRARLCTRRSGCGRSASTHLSLQHAVELC